MTILILSESPVPAEEVPTIEVAIDLRISALKNLWDKDPVATQSDIANQVARELKDKFRPRLFTSVQFSPQRTPRHGLIFRVWAESDSGRPCRDNDNPCRYFREVTIYANSEKATLEGTMWCDSSKDIGCNDRMRLTIEETKRVIVKSIMEITKQGNFLDHLSVIPIAERVILEKDSKPPCAVLPLRLDDATYKSLNEAGVKIVCRPDPASMKELILFGKPTGKEKTFAQPPPPKGVELNLNSAEDDAHHPTALKQAVKVAWRCKSHNALIRRREPEIYTVTGISLEGE
jgi:hypothetical protein